jgi:hypothetical protein
MFILYFFKNRDLYKKKPWSAPSLSPFFPAIHSRKREWWLTDKGKSRDEYKGSKQSPHPTPPHTPSLLPVRGRSPILLLYYSKPQQREKGEAQSHSQADGGTAAASRAAPPQSVLLAAYLLPPTPRRKAEERRRKKERSFFKKSHPHLASPAATAHTPSPTQLRIPYCMYLR